MDMPSAFDQLVDAVSEFAAERDWGQFHTPKNLAMALAGEAGELLAEFQWLTPDESQLVVDGEKFRDVSAELADVTIYAIRLAEVLGIDLLAACFDKLDLNAERYPVAESRGRAERPDLRA